MGQVYVREATVPPTNVNTRMFIFPLPHRKLGDVTAISNNSHKKSVAGSPHEGRAMSSGLKPD